MSWTGSERERREQGTCSAPSVAFDRRPRWFIPAGTPGYIRNVNQRHWSKYRTTHDNEFENFEEQTSFQFVFRHLGYQLLVNRRHVVDRTKP